MSEQKPPTGYVISNAVRTQRLSTAVPDRSRLSDILVKSPQWKKNVLGVEPVDASNSCPESPASTDPAVLKASLLDLIERHWLQLVTAAPSRPGPALPPSSPRLPAENDDDVELEAGRQAIAIAQREDELQQWRERVRVLEVRNAQLAARYEDEVNTRKAELQALREAFAQFQRESDQLLSELDTQNAVLRINDPE